MEAGNSVSTNQFCLLMFRDLREKCLVWTVARAFGIKKTRKYIECAYIDQSMIKTDLTQN